MGRSKKTISECCKELGLKEIPLPHDKFLAKDYKIDKHKIQKMRDLGLIRRSSRIGKCWSWVATETYWHAVKSP